MFSCNRVLPEKKLTGEISLKYSYVPTKLEHSGCYLKSEKEMHLDIGIIPSLCFEKSVESN